MTCIIHKIDTEPTLVTVLMGLLYLMFNLGRGLFNLREFHIMTDAFRAKRLFERVHSNPLSTIFLMFQ